MNDYTAELGSLVAKLYGWSNKPALGKSPAYVQALITEVPGLTKTDSLVLKLFGDRTLQRVHISDVPTIEVLEEARNLQVPEDDFIESLDVLQNARYLKTTNVYKVPYPQCLALTSYGFEEYAKAYIPSYSDIVTHVISQLVNTEDKNSDDIRLAINQPEIVVRHILDLLESRGLINTVQFLGRGIPLEVTEVSVKLKRLLRNT